MPKPVTDPELLAALNAPEPKGKVTDPALLAALEGGAHPLVGAHIEMSSADPMGNAIGNVTESTPAPEMSYGEQMRHVRGAVGDTVRSLANGIPFMDRIAAAGGAATGVGGKFGDYSGNLAAQRGEDKRLEEALPVLNTAGHIVGGTLVPLGAAAKVATLAKEVPLGIKTLYGMATGGAIGGVQGLSGTKDLTDIPQAAWDTGVGAVVGGAIGGALPGTARILGSGFQRAADFVHGRADGMSRDATKHMVRAVEADTPAAVRQRMAELGPDAMLADGGYGLLGTAQGAAGSSAEGRAVMMGSLKARDVGTNARIQADVDRALGPAEDPATVTAAIRQQRSDTDTINYGRATGAGAPPVDTDNLVVELGQMLSKAPTGGLEHKALTNLRNMLMTERRVPRPDPITGAHMSDRNGNLLYDAVPTPVRDPAVLHKVKGELDNVIEYDQPGLGIPGAAGMAKNGALKHFRGMLNGSMEGQVPGYLEANRASAALAQRADAVEAGTQYLGAGKTTPSPGRFSSEFNARPVDEKDALAKGSRGNIDRILGTTENDLVALKRELQGEGGWNTAKLATVHGQQAADDLVASVERNLKFRDTHTKVSEGAQTDLRNAARKEMKPDAATEIPFINPNAGFWGMTATALKKGVMGAVKALTESDPTRSYGEVARILSAQGPQRDRHLQAVVDAITKRQDIATAAPIHGNMAAVVAALLEKSTIDGALHRRDK